METIKTTLLISDDLDDHQSFTEAFEKVAPGMVVIAVLSQDKAMDLLSSRKLIPDYVFLDLTSPEADVSKFLSRIKTAEDGKKMTVTVYGDEDEFFSPDLVGVSKFDKDYGFPELVNFFENLLRKNS